MALGWFESLLRADWPDDIYDDLEDWLAGRDAVLNERVNTRRIDTILGSGGEVG